MRRFALLCALLTLAVIPVHAQGTQYPLPNSVCKIQASSYLDCSNMGTITVNGTQYQVASASDITNIYTYPASAPYVSGSVLGGTATSASSYNNYIVTIVFTGGEFPNGGKLTFWLVQYEQKPPCWRGCHVTYNAENVLLTLN